MFRTASESTAEASEKAYASLQRASSILESYYTHVDNTCLFLSSNPKVSRQLQKAFNEPSLSLESIRAIENSDVCVLMLDATRGIESQDLNIFSLVQKNKKGLVVCVNKWDLVEDKSQKVIDTFMSAIRERLAPFTDFPILFISALTKQRILKVLETAKDVYENRQRRVPTAKLNEIMLPIIENYPPPAWKGKYIKIKYITQLPAGQVPSFVFFCNLPQWIKEPYKRFLENKIRENWNFTGTPINVFIREK